MPSNVDDRLYCLVIYVDEMWLISRFWPASSWSAFQSSIRTNSDVKGWHNQLSQQARRASLTYTSLQRCCSTRRSLCLSSASWFLNAVSVGTRETLHRGSGPSGHVLDDIHRRWNDSVSAAEEVLLCLITLIGLIKWWLLWLENYHYRWHELQLRLCDSISLSVMLFANLD